VLKRLCITVAMVLAACGGGADVDAVRQELMEADLAFARDVAQQGLDAWVAHFAEDGVMFRSGEPVVGHDAIRALMAPLFADSTYSLRWKPDQAEVAASGDLGYTVGTYRSMAVGSQGVAIRGTGSYVTIWRRQPDGSWRVVLDIGSAAEAPDEGAGD
jgi:ketosteroid isomerase-like protein